MKLVNKIYKNYHNKMIVIKILHLIHFLLKNGISFPFHLIIILITSQKNLVNLLI